MSNDDYGVSSDKVLIDANGQHLVYLKDHPLIVEMRTKIGVLEDQITQLYVTVERLTLQTPIVTPSPKMFDFSEALKRLRAGKKVKRYGWQRQHFIVLAPGDRLGFSSDDHLWAVEIADCEATDWVEVE